MTTNHGPGGGHGQTPGAGQGQELGAGHSPGPGTGNGPGAGAGNGPAVHTITLLSRPGCHLCDDARAVVVRVAAELGVDFIERDITQSQEDLRAYGDMIPVTLIDGVQHDFWRVSEARLRAALSS